MMLRKPVINFETEVLRAQTEAIPMDRYAGDWKFKAYFPRGCKAEPSCRIEQLSFKRQDSSKPGWESWETAGVKKGEGCRLKDRKENAFGSTFLKSNQMLFSRAAKYDALLGDKNSVGFYYDQDARIGDRLFISQKNKKGCYIVYDKKSGKGNLWK